MVRQNRSAWHEAGHRTSSRAAGDSCGIQKVLAGRAVMWPIVLIASPSKLVGLRCLEP